MFEIDPNQPMVLELPGLFTLEECTELIARIESLGPEIAPINTLTGVEVRPDFRNNDRVMFDDEPLARTLLERVKNQAPAEVHGMVVVGVNERFRCYRYKNGMRFAPHKDGAFQRDANEWSCYSFLVYLNDDFEGGNTTFFPGYFSEPILSVRPKTGAGLLFQHKILHEGSIVTSGVKYVARTDLMYRRRDA
jgi:prolyl 4-hydroxylase